MRALPLITLLLAACPAPRPPPPGPGSETAKPKPPPPEVIEPSDDEKLAAIQKAMNELDEAAQACWAAAATERFDIEGEVTLTIEIAAKRSTVAIAHDSARNAKLGACLRELLASYSWAPPLHGQTIQLPFKFSAPDGQNVIDRALVAWAGQGKIAIATLVDENNTGNGAASMFELAVETGGSTGFRSPERDELWYFLGPAEIDAPTKAGKRMVAAGDMMFVPKGAVRKLTATSAAVHAVIIAVPGGREGSARAGALPTREVSEWKEPPPGPIHLPAAAAKSYPRPGGTVAVFADPSTIKAKSVSASVMEIAGDASIPEHVHAGETELVYILSGTGTLTVNGVPLAITATSVVQIPPNTKHKFTGTSPLRAISIYTPAGPEQRFKKKP